jgi:hypothetical protein
MQNGSTLFLKAVICLIGLAALGLCVIFLGMSFSGNGGIYTPLLIGMAVIALPFFFALYQGLVLLSAIDKNTAFSERSVKAIRNIKFCAAIMSALYALSMPFVVRVAQKDDAPGVVLIALVLLFAPLVTAVFAAVLQKLLQKALDMKAENDLTV